MLNERLEESAVTRTMPTEVDATSEGGMIGRERWDEIRRMYYEERFGISRIARTLDLDGKTVRRCVRQREWRPYRRTKGEPTLLSKHEAYLRERAPRVCYSARILYQELTKDRAYTGSYETVKRFVAPLRELQVLAEGTQMRFETAPGQQSQIDWGQALVSFSSARRPVHFFVMTLGFSRRGFYFACADERLGQFLDAHERAFEYFGGHTHEHLYDRARTVCYPNGEGRVVWTLLLACIGLLAIWPAFLMPRGLYELVYGWRYPKVRDCGDAILTDSGPGASADRYVADYGYLPLDAETEMTFRLCALPREWMFLGLAIELPGDDKLSSEVEQFRTRRVRDVEVAVSVTAESGRAVFAHDGPLGEHWVWSYGYPPATAFLYADDTMFVPQSRETYELHVSISPSDSSTDTRARLVVKGGGWKAPAAPSKTN